MAVALAAVAGLTLAAGVAPGAALRALWEGGFGGSFAWTGTLLRATPILLTGLSVAWAFRGGLFNIGAEGQLLWGALAAGWVGYAFRLPALLHLPAALAAGALAGALWALPAAYLKAYRRVPEVITTLLLSFIAGHLVRFMANGPLHDPSKQGARTPDVLPTAVLPTLGDSRLHVGLLLAVLIAAGLAVVIRNSGFGFRLAIVGRNPETARSSNIAVERVWFLTLLQSGALAGLAGAVEALGIHHFFQAGFSPGYGYEGIAVAILGGSTPAGVALAALFWGGLANGAVEMELSVGVSRNLVTVIQALVVLCVAVRRWPKLPFLSSKAERCIK